MKFFSSDFHISHKNICEYTDRKLVTDQEGHDSWLVDLLNSQIKKGDILYILGDISFARDKEYTKKILNSINGQKVIVKGNHDRTDTLKYLLEENCIQSYQEYKDIKIQGVHTCMMHYPIQSWDRKSYGAYHLHGHNHGAPSGVIGRILDVGLDSAYNLFGEHRVFSENDIHDILSKVEFSTRSHSRRTD